MAVSTSAALHELGRLDRRAPASDSEEIEDSPSLARYLDEIFERCYRAAREHAAAETGSPRSRFPQASPFTIDQTLDPEFLPD